jgi:hypothetical protein
LEIRSATRAASIVLIRKLLSRNSVTSVGHYLWHKRNPGALTPQAFVITENEVGRVTVIQLC